MPERQDVKTEKIVYEGIFKLPEVYKLINDWAKDKDYVLVEKKCLESVTEKGKNVECEFEPFKKLTDYAQSKVNVKVAAFDCTEVEVKKDKKRQKFSKGRLEINVDAYLETDYEARWEAKPVFFVLRTLFEKYLYAPFLSGFTKRIKSDAEILIDNIKAFLNLYKY